MPFDPQGRLLTQQDWESHREQWLPSASDKAFIKSLQSRAVTALGQMANWIAPPPRGINGKPLDFVYLRGEA
jgi:benzoyl-CoA 2,3-dioxygenase component B